MKLSRSARLDNLVNIFFGVPVL